MTELFDFLVSCALGILAGFTLGLVPPWYIYNRDIRREFGIWLELGFILAPFYTRGVRDYMGAQEPLPFLALIFVYTVLNMNLGVLAYVVGRVLWVVFMLLSGRQPPLFPGTEDKIQRGAP